MDKPVPLKVNLRPVCLPLPRISFAGSKVTYAFIQSLSAGSQLKPKRKSLACLTLTWERKRKRWIHSYAMKKRWCNNSITFKLKYCRASLPAGAIHQVRSPLSVRWITRIKKQWCSQQWIDGIGADKALLAIRRIVVAKRSFSFILKHLHSIDVFMNEYELSFCRQRTVMIRRLCKRSKCRLCQIEIVAAPATVNHASLTTCCVPAIWQVGQIHAR